MNTVNVIRCWKNFQQDDFVTIAVFLERFKGRYNFNINLTITHRQDIMVKSRVEEYIKRFNEKNNTKHSISFYTVDELDVFLKETYNIPETTLQALKSQPVLYNIVLGFYARNILKFNYVLMHDSDILFTRQSLPEIEECLDNEIPFAIQHPYTFADLALVGKLTLLIGKDVFTPYANRGLASSNTGFMGLNLSCLDLFSNDQVQKLFTEIFLYDSFPDDEQNPHFADGAFSFLLYSQEQSFYSLVARARSNKFTILDTNSGHAIFLDEESLASYNPKIHHYAYELKNGNYRRGFIDYYLSKIERNVDIFGEE